MRALRHTIIVSLLICVISLLIAVLITVNSNNILTNLDNCLLCIFSGILASSIVVLLSSLTSLASRKREIASSYTVPLMQVDNELRFLQIYTQRHLAPNNSIVFGEDDFPQLLECYSILAERFLALVQIERISWIPQKQFDRFQKVLDKHGMAFLESSFKKTCAQASACCTIVAHELRVHPFYTEADIAAQSIEVINLHSNCLNELTRIDGLFLLYRTDFRKLLDKITRIQK